MPYAPEHKIRTRQRIVEVAKGLFNRRGFSEVSIDQIMAEAGLTRGGFYHHFRSKEELFAAAVDSFACDTADTTIAEKYAQGLTAKELAVNLLSTYLSEPHMEDINQQCPMVALPSDIARAGKDVRRAYGKLAQRMTSVFQDSMIEKNDEDKQDASYVLAALCVGGMVLARTIDDEATSQSLLAAVREFGVSFIENSDKDDKHGHTKPQQAFREAIA